MALLLGLVNPNYTQRRIAMVQTYQTIEPFIDDYGDVDEYQVFEWGEFESHSVLAGQPCKTLIHAFRTASEAQRAYPDAEVAEYPIPPPVNTVDHLPDWEMTAREEEDYFSDPNEY